MKTWIKTIWLTFHLFLLSFAASGNVESTTGTIHFDSNFNGAPEMTLNSIGLGIGTSAPSANLEVSGNTIISQSLTVGSSSEGSANLNITGSFGMSLQNVSSNTLLGNSSLILADSSSDNLTLTLPDALNCDGRVYTIKKISSQNNILLSGNTWNNWIDNQDYMLLQSGSMSAVSLISNSGNWSVLKEYGTTSLANTRTLFRDTFSNGNTQEAWVETTVGSTVYDYGTSGVATFVPGNAQPSALWHNFEATQLEDGDRITLSFDMMMSSVTPIAASIRFGIGYSSSPLVDGSNFTVPVDGYMSSAPFLGDNGDCVNYWLDGDPAGMNWGNAATTFYANGALDDTDTYSITNSELRTIRYEISRSGNDLIGRTYVNGAYSASITYTDIITNYTFNAFGLIGSYNAGETFTYDNVEIIFTK